MDWPCGRRSPRGGSCRVRLRLTQPQHVGVRHPGCPAHPVARASSTTPTGARRPRRRHHRRPILDRPGPGQPVADPVACGGRQVGGPVAVAPPVSSDGAARARHGGDHHRSRRPQRNHRLAGPAPRRRLHHLVHRRSGLDIAPSADVGRVGLPAAELHGGLTSDVSDPGRRGAGRHLHLALGRSTGLADVTLDARHQQRDHQGCGDELRVAAQPQDRRHRRT